MVSLLMPLSFYLSLYLEDYVFSDSFPNNFHAKFFYLRKEL